MSISFCLLGYFSFA